MRKRIPVCFNATAEPVECFSVSVKVQLGEADHHHPAVGENIARRQAKSFVDMRLRLRATAHKILGPANLRMRLSQIAIQRQRTLELVDALSSSVCGNQQ